MLRLGNGSRLDFLRRSPPLFDVVASSPSLPGCSLPDFSPFCSILGSYFGGKLLKGRAVLWGKGWENIFGFLQSLGERDPSSISACGLMGTNLKCPLSTQPFALTHLPKTWLPWEILPSPITRLSFHSYYFPPPSFRLQKSNSAISLSFTFLSLIIVLPNFTSCTSQTLT